VQHCIPAAASSACGARTSEAASCSSCGTSAAARPPYVEFVMRCHNTEYSHRFCTRSEVITCGSELGASASDDAKLSSCGTSAEALVSVYDIRPRSCAAPLQSFFFFFLSAVYQRTSHLRLPVRRAAVERQRRQTAAAAAPAPPPGPPAAPPASAPAPESSPAPHAPPLASAPVYVLYVRTWRQIRLD
jgi:hypothetical protein